mmetsp:Transcript_30485/g.59550  ORF Transcript_30485/g.59550 Transcript_30485/m.59550 type:complete len:408 (+) Transcript_30485:44-1267(+)
MVRGGKLKERDPLFELVLKWITTAEWDMTLTLREAMAKAENLIEQHVENPTGSELSRKCPGISAFFTKLPLCRALDNLSKRVAVEERRFVPPTFSEVRQVFNIAQVYEMKGRVEMLTFDADDTIYEHGMDLDKNSWIVDALCTIMEMGIYIAVVTAAGYPGKPDRYAARFKGLLEKFAERKYAKDVTDKFLVMGGECNYMFIVKSDYTLEEVPWDKFATDAMRSWKDEDVTSMMDLAEKSLTESCKRLRLDVQCLRKSRAVGCYPKQVGDRLAYEALEDVAMSVHDALRNHAKVPFCAFNGNLDVWVDLGDKRYGIEALQQYLGISEEKCCHMGDRFTHTGNDARARYVAMTVWVTNPVETEDYLELFLNEMGADKAKGCAINRRHGPMEGSAEWIKAQVVQRNTAS